MCNSDDNPGCDCWGVDDTVNWLRMEKRIRDILRLVNQQCVTEERLRDALTSIDEIIAHETGRGHEISSAGLSGAKAVTDHEQESQDG